MGGLRDWTPSMPTPSDTRQTAFIATLGTEPQVVTATLDLLHAGHGLIFDGVVVIHTAREGRIADSISTVERELASYKSRGIVKACDLIGLKRADGTDLSDVNSREDAGIVFTSIYNAVKQQKKQRRIVHLNVAGGRKGMTAFGMAAAQLLFEPGDCMWLLVSSTQFQENRSLHPRILETPADQSTSAESAVSEDAQLLPVPVLRYSSLPTTVMALLAYDDPMEAIRQQERFVDRQSDAAKTAFLDSLSEKQRDIVEDIARHAMSNKDIARKHHLAEKTVENYLDIIYRRLAGSGVLPRGAPANRQTIILLFSGHAGGTG